ncbi:MAG: formyltransferase family protein [Candidatus Omnitrophota bacterium]
MKHIFDKRSFPRRRIRIGLDLKSNNQSIKAEIIDLNPFGLMAQLDGPLNIGQAVNLGFMFSSKPFYNEAKVVWVNVAPRDKDKNCRWEAGFEFTKISQDWFDRIDSFLSLKKINRIVILTLDSLYSNIALRKIIKEFSDKISLICLSERFSKRRGSMVKQTLNNLKDSGLLFVVYSSFYVILHNFFIRLLRWFSVHLFRRASGVYTIEEIAKQYVIPVIETDAINSERVLKRMKNIEPELIISCHFDQRVRNPMLEIPKYGAINLHYALLPEFRGPFPTFWALKQGKDRVGVTVHFMNEKLDEGDIVHQQEAKVRAGDSVLSLNCRLLNIGAELIIKAIRKIEYDVLEKVSQQDIGIGTYHSYPKKQNIREFTRKRAKLFSLRHYLKNLS